LDFTRLGISPFTCCSFLMWPLWISFRKKDDSDVATGMNYVVPSSSSWYTSTCYLKMAITRIRGPLKTTAFFKVNTFERVWTSWLAPIPLKSKPLGSHTVGWNRIWCVDHRW
jgi:hypothetical protein